MSTPPPSLDKLPLDLMRQHFASDDELRAYLAELVRSYCTLMNALERDVLEKDARGYYKDMPYDPVLEPSADFADYQARYRPIFEAFCTHKKRSYGGDAGSYGHPAKFDELENATQSVQLTLKNASRAEACFVTTGGRDFLFVLLRKGGLWRIDSYKYRFRPRDGREEKWNNGIL